MTFILVLEMDLSLTTGYSINERESAVALLDQSPEEIIVYASKPKYPDVFHDPRITYLVNHRRYNPLFYLFHMISTFWQLRKDMGKHKVEGVIFRPGLIPLVPFFISLTKTPVYLKTVALARFQRQDFKNWKHRIANFFAKPLFGFLGRNMAGADTMSQVYIDYLEHSFNADRKLITKIENGVNPSFFKPYSKATMKKKYGLSHFQKIIGYVGAVTPHRRLDRILHVLPKLADPSIALVIVGRGKQIQELELLADKLSIADRVLFLGFKPYEHIPEIASCFDIAIDLTLHHIDIGGQISTTSYSQKIAQFLSCEVPVATWRTFETKFIDEFGLGSTTPYDLELGLKDCLDKLFMDEENRRILGENARRYVLEHLSYNQLSKKRLSFWKKTNQNVQSA